MSFCNRFLNCSRLRQRHLSAGGETTAVVRGGSAEVGKKKTRKKFIFFLQKLDENKDLKILKIFKIINAFLAFNF